MKLSILSYDQEIGNNMEWFSIPCTLKKYHAGTLYFTKIPYVIMWCRIFFIPVILQNIYSCVTANVC